MAFRFRWHHRGKGHRQTDHLRRPIIGEGSHFPPENAHLADQPNLPRLAGSIPLPQQAILEYRIASSENRPTGERHSDSPVGLYPTSSSTLTHRPMLHLMRVRTTPVSTAHNQNTERQNTHPGRLSRKGKQSVYTEQQFTVGGEGPILLGSDRFGFVCHSPEGCHFTDQRIPNGISLFRNVRNGF